MQVGVLLRGGDSVHPDREGDARGLDEEAIVERGGGIVGGKFFEEIEFAEGFEAVFKEDPLPHHLIWEELGFGFQLGEEFFFGGGEMPGLQGDISGEVGGSFGKDGVLLKIKDGGTGLPEPEGSGEGAGADGGGGRAVGRMVPVAAFEGSVNEEEEG